MRFVGKLVLALTLLCATPVVAQAGDVTLVIAHAHQDGGALYAQLCTQDEFLKRCALRNKVAAKDDKVTITFPDVPPGPYAATVFQDVNDNAKLDRGAFGAPSEPWGISRNAKNPYGPPVFDDAKVDVTDKPLTLKISLE